MGNEQVDHLEPAISSTLVRSLHGWLGPATHGLSNVVRAVAGLMPVGASIKDPSIGALGAFLSGVRAGEGEDLSRIAASGWATQPEAGAMRERFLAEGCPRAGDEELTLLLPADVGPVRGRVAIACALGQGIDPALRGAAARVVQAMRGPYEESLATGPLALAKRQWALLQRLTPQQQIVAVRMATGATERDIANELHRSVNTVHSHAKMVYNAWDVGSRAELVLRWHTQPGEELAGATA
jgi:DNA-binding CsgD family transcriptional regulator